LLVAFTAQVTGVLASKILHILRKAARQNTHLRCMMHTWPKPCKDRSSHTLVYF